MLVAGGWLDQPWYYRAVIIQHLNLDNWHDWNSKRPSTLDLPNFEDM